MCEWKHSNYQRTKVNLTISNRSYSTFAQKLHRATHLSLSPCILVHEHYDAHRAYKMREQHIYSSRECMMCTLLIRILMPVELRQSHLFTNTTNIEVLSVNCHRRGMWTSGGCHTTMSNFIFAPDYWLSRLRGTANHKESDLLVSPKIMWNQFLEHAQECGRKPFQF